MAKATAGGNVPLWRWSKPGPMTQVQGLSSEVKGSVLHIHRHTPSRLWWLGALLSYNCFPKTCRGVRSSSSSSISSTKSNQVALFSMLSVMQKIGPVLSLVKIIYGSLLMSFNTYCCISFFIYIIIVRMIITNSAGLVLSFCQNQPLYCQSHRLHSQISYQTKLAE